jgi:hypothetical protein
MDLSKSFDSPYLKARINVDNGDTIKFLDEGMIDAEKRVNFDVDVFRNGNKLHTKKFTLNKTNFNAISALYGVDSKKWIGKQMGIEIYKAKRPTDHTLVDAIMLVAPSVQHGGDVEEIDDNEGLE